MAVEEKNTNSNETEIQVDLDAAQAEISSDLFGQGKDDESSSSGEPGSEAAVSESGTPPPAQKTEPAANEGQQPSGADPEPDNSAAVQEIGAPKTWTKEALEDWAKIPPRAQQEIAKREEDFMRGITMYKSAAELGTRYDQVVEPYRAILQQINLDPVELFKSFSANHYLLSQGTPEQKIELAANMINGYGIDLAGLLEYIGGHAYEPPNQEVEALKREVASLRGNFTSQQSQQSEAIRSQIFAAVNTFGDDPAHPYFDEVADDITRLIQSGLATDLNDAYDKAVFANPATRQKEIDRIRGEATSEARSEEQKRKDKIARLTGDHVETTPTSRSGTVPLGSMDETLRATYEDIASRG